MSDVLLAAGGLDSQLLRADHHGRVGDPVLRDQDVYQASPLRPPVIYALCAGRDAGAKRGRSRRADHRRVDHHDRARGETHSVRKRASTTLRTRNLGSEISKEPTTATARFPNIRRRRPPSTVCLMIAGELRLGPQVPRRFRQRHRGMERWYV
jgi:hypothetical protein